MDKKSFFLGVVTGIVLTFAVLFVIGLVNQNSEDNDQIQYLEHPVSYENKAETSFKVLQVIGNAALAFEESKIILGKNFYSDQIVTIKNPQRVGTYSYTNKGGRSMTVPVLDGEISE